MSFGDARHLGETLTLPLVSVFFLILCAVLLLKEKRKRLPRARHHVYKMEQNRVGGGG